MRSDSLPVAAVELGGTKCVLALASGPDGMLDHRRLPTEDPETTLQAIEAVLDEWGGGFAALGIACFGPIVLDRDSGDWGRIAATPKPGWAGTDVARRLSLRYGVPTAFDTDVAGAALAERRWGAARDLEDFAYVTVGTGIGVALVARGRLIGGFMHPEAGHVRVARRRGDDWRGVCPFHDGCAEGLASGPAIEARLGRPASEAGPDHPVWDDVAEILAQLCQILALVAAPRRILLGGGVMTAQPHLFARIRKVLTASLGGYVTLPETDYVVPPGLGALAGPYGGIALALDALAEEKMLTEDGFAG